MTDDDIMLMAQKAGPLTQGPFTEWCKRFANLVAAAEREGVAEMFEASPELVRLAQNDQGGCIICGLNPKTEAKAIRARGDTK
jgi:hypothetical protein